MDNQNTTAIRKTKFFDGLLIATIAIVFLLILCDVFGISGKYIKEFLIGVFGIVVYGYFFALLTYGICLMLGWNKQRSVKGLLHFLGILIIIVLIAHTSTSTQGFFDKSLGFGDNYRRYLIYCYNAPITAGGIIAGVFTYPLMKITLIAQYLLLCGVLVFLIVTYHMMYIKGSIAPYRIIKRREPKSKRKKMIQKNIGDELVNQNIYGEDLEDDLKLKIFPNKHITYTPIEETEKIINQKKNTNKTKDLAKEEFAKVEEEVLDYINEAYIDPNPLNIFSTQKEVDMQNNKSKAYDFIFNKGATSEKEEPSNKKSFDSYPSYKVENDNGSGKPFNNYSNNYQKQDNYTKNKQDSYTNYSNNNTNTTAKKTTTKQVYVEPEQSEETKLLNEMIRKSYTNKAMYENILNNVKQGKTTYSVNKNTDGYTEINTFVNDDLVDNNVIDDGVEDVKDIVIDSRTGENKLDEIFNDKGYNNDQQAVFENNKYGENISYNDYIKRENEERDKRDRLEQEKIAKENERLLKEQEAKRAELERLEKELEEKKEKLNKIKSEETTVEENVEDTPTEKNAPLKKNRFAKIVLDSEEEAVEEEVKEEKKLIKFEKYHAPSIDLLKDYNEEIDPGDIEEKKEIIINTLKSFGIEVTIPNVVVGPTFSRFEVDLPINVPVNKIAQQENDLQMRLGVESLIIQAPIPGKKFVGIEIPNAHRAMVGFKNALKSKEFDEKKKLGFVLGKDVDGKYYIGDLTKMPHLLIAGATGAGKSVGVNCLITSMLYKYSPEYVRFILVDPKQVEFSMYSGIPHLLVPDPLFKPDQVISALDWLILEMENRYELFSKSRCQKLDQYNAKIDPKTTQKLPYIVMVVDEVADIMMVMKNAFETRVTRLAAKARAAGIHLVLATQRPSVDIITGSIKANLTGRIAYTTTSQVDSMTILNHKGAEKLLRRGDMLFVDPERMDPIRMQGAFLDSDEIIPVVDYINAHNKHYFDESTISQIIDPPKNRDGDQEMENKAKSQMDVRLEPRFAEALQFFISQGKASTTSLIRNFSIGYNKAADYLQAMKDYGYIENTTGSSSKGSQVIITQEEFDDIFSELERLPEEE